MKQSMLSCGEEGVIKSSTVLELENKGHQMTHDALAKVSSSLVYLATSNG